MLNRDIKSSCTEERTRVPNMCKSLLGYFIVLATCFQSQAVAQHPIDVQRKVATGEFFEALRIFEKMPKRKTTTEAVIAAAKAAWALSLPSRAIEEFDKALRNESLTPTLRARLLLSRGIIEYQEARYQVSILYAEKAVELLAMSPLRARAWLLWGESLHRLESFGAAEHKYLKALDEVTEGEQADVHFLLGRAQIKLGKLEEARRNFESVPLHHVRTPETMRNLALVSLEERNFEQVRFWLAKGREEYPDSFLDSWVDYALVRVAVHEDNASEVRALRTGAGQKYPPSDHWLTLLHATAEAYEWERGKLAKRGTQ